MLIIRELVLKVSQDICIHDEPINTVPCATGVVNCLEYRSRLGCLRCACLAVHSAWIPSSYQRPYSVRLQLRAAKARTGPGFASPCCSRLRSTVPAWAHPPRRPLPLSRWHHNRFMPPSNGRVTAAFWETPSADRHSRRFAGISFEPSPLRKYRPYSLRGLFHES